MNKIRILLADDHAILREGIRALLEDYADFSIVGEADDGRKAVERTGQLQPDVVLMDIGMPVLNGLQATRQIKHDYPHVHVLALTMHDSEEYVSQMLAAGASGYVIKCAASDELVQAIRAVAAGQNYISPAVTRVLVESLIAHRANPRSADPFQTLTEREREVFQLVAEGHTSREIAEKLGVSIMTVKAHRANMMAKLGVHDRSELVKIAIQRGIIEV